MIDPQMVDAFKTTTSSLLVPTTTSVSPIPTVIPNPPHYEKVGETGTKTLWVREILPRGMRIELLTPSGCLCHNARVDDCIRHPFLQSPSRKFSGQDLKMAPLTPR